MNVSYAAIALAYYIVYGKILPDDAEFETESYKLENEGHYTLLCMCARINDIDWKTPELYVHQIPGAILSKYRIGALDWEGTPRYLRYKNGGFVKKGDTNSGYTVTGGTAPHKQGSTGRVWHTNGEFFPSVLKMEWT